MITDENIFKGNPSLFTTVDFEAPIRNTDKPSCRYFSSLFAAAAKCAEEAGDSQNAHTYHFLDVLTSFGTSFDTPEQPYVPFIQMEGKRSALPTDLTAADILAIRELAPICADPALRARLYDVLWEVTKDHRACAESALAYVLAAKRLNTPDQWVHAAECFKRGLQLAAKLGRNKELFKTTSESLQNAVRVLADDNEKFRCARYLRIIFDNSCGDPAEFATIAAAFAKKAADAGDPYQARNYWQLEAEFQKAAKNTEAEKSANLAAAETYVIEAENHTQGPTVSAAAAASLLQNGIEALRRAGAPRERIDQLRVKLSQYQQDSLKEMKTYTTEVDISAGVEFARKHVSATNLREALMKFALGHDVTDLKYLREMVFEQAKQAPLLHLMGASIVDAKGRTTATKPGFFNLKGEELEQQVELEMFSKASQFMWPIRVSSYINPCRLQILDEHNPTFDDLAFLVRNNPLVPAGHEGIFLRGIHAGFIGNFLITSHLLVPQIENSLRYVLESSGVDVSNLMSDGTQPVKVLGALLGMQETKRIFGESLCFELRGCLIEKTGYDFRNRLAHGFVSEADCYSGAALMIWWLVLRICLIPIYHGEEGAPAPTS